MFVWLWVFGVVAFTFSWRAKKELKDAGVTAGARSIIATQLTEILGIYLASGLLLLLIELWVRITEASDPVLRVLWEWQATLELLSSLAAKLRIPGSIATGILLVAAIGAWRHQSELTVTIYGWLSSYQKVVKRAVLVATALASFTLFSGTLDEGKARIETRVHTLSDHYASYIVELERTAAQSVTARAIENIAVTLPHQWKAVNERNEAIWMRTNDLNRILNSLRENHNVKTDFPETNRSQPSPSKLRPKPSNQSAPGEKPNSPTSKREPLPREAGGFSEGKIASLRADLNAYINKIGKPAAEFLQTQMGGKVPESLLGNVLSHKNWAALHGIANDYPLLDALLGVLDKAITAEIAERIKQTVFRLARDPNIVDPAAEITTATESTAPIDWSPAKSALALADRRSKTELTLLNAALRQSEIIESKVIAAETAAFEAREAALTKKWSDIAGVVPEIELPRGTISLTGSAVNEPSSPENFFRSENPPTLAAATRVATPTPISTFIESLHAPGVTPDRRVMAMNQAEAVLAGSGTTGEKAERIGKLTFAPSQPSQIDTYRDLRSNLFRSFGDDLSMKWQNAYEREEQDRIDKIEYERLVANSQIERELWKKRGYGLEDYDGVRAVKGIRIGKWELPRIPWRLLGEVRTIP